MKICGFGRSRLAPTEKDVNMTNSVGSDLWSAPEVLKNEPYGKPADVFSFGILIPFLSIPFPHLIFVAGIILSEVLTKEPPKPRIAFPPQQPWVFIPRGQVSKGIVPTGGPTLVLWNIMLHCVSVFLHITLWLLNEQLFFLPNRRNMNQRTDLLLITFFRSCVICLQRWKESRILLLHQSHHGLLVCQGVIKELILCHLKEKSFFLRPITWHWRQHLSRVFRVIVSSVT